MALGPDQFSRHGLGLGDRVSLARPGMRPREFVAVGTVLVPGFFDDPFAAGVVLTPGALDGVRQNEGLDRLVLNWRRGVNPSDALRRLRRALPDAVNAYSHPRPPGDVANLASRRLPARLGAFLVVLRRHNPARSPDIGGLPPSPRLAVLRCMGFVRFQLLATVAWQSMTLVVVALVVGLLGMGLGRWTWTIVADQIGVATDALTPAVAFTLVVPAALGAACLLAAGPAWLAARTHADVLWAE